MCKVMIDMVDNSETAEKEVQDTSCRGSGGVPQLKISPKHGGYRGLIESISAVSNKQPVISIGEKGGNHEVD